MTAPPNPARRTTAVVLALLCGGFLVHAFVTRFCCDDGAILWRYAKHLAEGYGLRYNPTFDEPPVQGSSNLPFTVLMAVGYRLGADPEMWSWALGLSFGAGALLAAHALARRAGLGATAALVATAALAVNHSFAAWCTGGLGMKLYTLLVLLAWLRFLREEQDPSISAAPSAALFGAVALTRPEGFVFFLMALGWRLLPWLGRVVGRAGPPPGTARRLAVFAAVFVAFKLAQTGFSLAYFGDFVANTVRAKVNGFWWQRGLWYLGRFAEVYSAWVPLPLALLACLPGRGVDPVPVRLLLLVAIGFALGIAAIGGDRFEFRMLDPSLPGLYIAAAAGAARLAQWARPVGILAGGAVIASSAAGSVLRWQDGIFNDDFVRVEFINDVYERRKRVGLMLRKHLPRDARIAAKAAGAAPLFSELYTLDVHGLNDAAIAARPVDERGLYAHEKVARKEDYDRARVDYVLVDITDDDPVAHYAIENPHLTPEQIAAIRRSPALTEKVIEHYRRDNNLFVELEPGVYLYAETRGPAEPYRQQWRERGYRVIF